jgi:hypothetical protein
VIEHNIIDANGEGIIFSGDNGVASNNTTVRENLITNARIRFDVESWYPSGNPIGIGNFVEHNCVWAGAEGTITNEAEGAGAGAGFTATDNLTADPEFADPAAGDYRVNPASPCAALISANSLPTEPFGSSSSTGTTTETSTSLPTEPFGSSSSTGTTTETSTGTTHDHRGKEDHRLLTKAAVATVQKARVLKARGATRHHRHRRGAMRRRHHRHIRQRRARDHRGRPSGRPSNS